MCFHDTDTINHELAEVEVWEEDHSEKDLGSGIRVSDDCTTPVMDSSFALVLWLWGFYRKNFLPNAAVQLLVSFLSIFLKVLGRLAPQLSKISDYFV